MPCFKVYGPLFSSWERHILFSSGGHGCGIEVGDVGGKRTSNGHLCDFSWGQLFSVVPFTVQARQQGDS